MTTSDTNNQIDAHRAATLGCTIDDLHAARCVVVAHAAAMREYAGIYALRHNDACVISAPPDRVAAVASAIEGHDADAVFTTRFLASLAGADLDRTIGPAWIGFIDGATFRRDAAQARAVRLSPPQHEAVIALRDACNETEWQHSGIDPDRPPIFAVFDGEAIAAATSYEAMGGGIKHVGAIAHPAYRGRGLARAAASAITSYALDEGGIPQWQTLRANAASLAIASALGYVMRYESIAVRLRA